MGTRYSIKIVERADSHLTQQDVASAVDALLRKINDQMSTYLAESEVSRFNRAPANKWFDVSSATATVVRQALRICKQTGGAYDITIEPLVELWNFGPQPKNRHSLNVPPSDQAIQAALQRIGYEHLKVRIDPPALRKSQSNLEIDLSSIAKGYAVDQVGKLLEERDLTDYMVEIGGEVRTHGVRQDGNPWQIGIEKPDAANRHLQIIVPLRNQAVATSGDYRIFFESDGRRYSHLIDPRTGRPVQHTLASVSVLADRCAQADALATALLILGPDKGYDWSVKHDIAALFMSRSSGSKAGSPQGGIVQKATPKFEQLVPLESNSDAGNTSLWTTLILTAAIIALAILSMAIGVIVSNRRLRGSCGGLAGLRDAQGRTLCDACTDPTPECRGEPLKKPRAKIPPTAAKSREL